MQPTPPKQPRFLDQVRLVCRRSHFSARTEEAYIFWIRRFILFHGKRHPSEMGMTEVVCLPQSLGRCASGLGKHSVPGTQCLAGVYKRVLETDPGWFDGLTRVQRKKRFPGHGRPGRSSLCS